MLPSSQMDDHERESGVGWKRKQSIMRGFLLLNLAACAHKLER